MKSYWQRSTVEYVATFVGLQFTALALAIALMPLVAYLALTRRWELSYGKMHWRIPANRRLRRIVWLVDNKQDGIVEPGTPLTRWNAFYWCAIRNSVHNFGYLSWAYRPLWPLWYRTWTAFGKQWYVKAGWMSNGLMCCSAGAGRGY